MMDYAWRQAGEVTALPFNGGIYNILLNCSRSKRLASLVATLTILSYIATAVQPAARPAGCAVGTETSPNQSERVLSFKAKLISSISRRLFFYSCGFM